MSINPVIDYLKTDVEAHDERFDYAHWDVVNALYNKGGRAFDSQSELPLNADRKFDLIWMFSVITHQYPEGSAALFKLLRNYAAPDGRMFFTAFIGAHVKKFRDVLEDQPLMMAYYQREYLLELLDESGWKVDKSLPPDPTNDPPAASGLLSLLRYKPDDHSKDSNAAPCPPDARRTQTQTLPDNCAQSEY